MEPHERDLLHAVVQFSNLDTIGDLQRRLVRKHVFTQEYIDRHSEEILEIFEGCRPDVGTSSSERDVDGRQDYALSSHRRARVLALYGPVDNRVTAGSISLFKPQSGTFGFASSRQSEGEVSFIQSKTVENNKLEPEDDGTVIFQWRQPSRGAVDLDRHDDQTARTTCCIILSDKEAKKLGMKVDIVFGVHHSKLIRRQKYCMPVPPRCPTPLETETTPIHQAALALRSNDFFAMSNRPCRSRYRSLSSPPEHLRSHSSGLDRWAQPLRHHDGRRQDLYQYSGAVSDDREYGQPEWRPRSRPNRRNPRSCSSRSSGRPSRKRQQRKADGRTRGLAGLGFRVGAFADDIFDWIDRCLSRLL